MSRILVIGDLMVDRYRFFKPLRSDPANNVALVVECEKQVDVDGGAGNLVRNLESLCEKEVSFFHYCGENIPTKIRYYVEDKFILREDKYDSINHDKSTIEKFINFIEPNDFVIISDYHKGTLNYGDIFRIKEECSIKGAISFVDTNHIWDSHNNIDWLKVNLKTAQDFMRDKNRTDGFMMISKDIAEITGSNVIVTLGDKGCVAYIKELSVNIIFTKDENNDCVDTIGAGDTFLAGFVAYMARWQGETHIPALVYADIVAHLSTQRLGTIDVVSKSMADEIYRNTKTNIVKGPGGKLFIHRGIDK